MGNTSRFPPKAHVVPFTFELYVTLNKGGRGMFLGMLLYGGISRISPCQSFCGVSLTDN